MLYVEILICHRFKYDGPFAFSISIIVLPSNWTILPFVMHAVQGAKQIGKSTCLVYSQLLKEICPGASSGTPQTLHAQ